LYGDKDPDALIAMYRLPDQDATWRRSVIQRITASATQMKNEMAQYKNLMKRQPLGPNREQFDRRLAMLNNQYAWLVANTEGDFSGALAASLESLEYTPGSPVYLDTLARCYFANKDYANAVKHQRMAVEQIPHSGLMQRQLKEFEAALEKQGR
jgi:tetratricopeptide (TPR) repeat protein